MQLMIDDGIFPSNSLPFRLRYPKLFSFENGEKIVPWRLFMPRFKTERELLKFPKHCGIKPLKLLLDKSRSRRTLSLQTEEEISPVNLLLDARERASRFSCLKIELGIGPCKLFLLISNNLNERVLIWEGIGPESWLLDKPKFSRRVRLPKNSGILPEKLLLPRYKDWSCTRFLNDDGMWPPKLLSARSKRVSWVARSSLVGYQIL